MADPLLTSAERKAVDMLGQVYTLLCDEVVAHCETREDDCAELRSQIHVLQRTIMAQAAARSYPAEFRLLGSVIEGTSGPALR